jgi:O-methyltransferase
MKVTSLPVLLAAMRKARQSGDPLVRFAVLRQVARWILPQYRFKWPQMDWWENASFNAYLDRFGEQTGANTDRRWMLFQLMRLVDSVPGDTCECGVWKGAGSYLICSMNRRSRSKGRNHFIFDSFEGLSDPTPSEDGPYWTRGDLSHPMDSVRQTLADFENVRMYKGWIPDRFAEVADRRFAFVHIDVDLYQPTLDCIQFFHPRLNPGGIIVCDDYGFNTCPGATRAVDRYLSDKSEKMVALSCGGGFLIKGVTTDPSMDLLK